MLAMLDVEASSLSPALSYPLEIGWVAHDFSAGYVALVRPEPDWDDWDRESESVHGLSRYAVERYGEPACDVVAALSDMLDGAEVLTDSPGTDSRWLRRLFAATSVKPTFPVWESVQGGPPKAVFDVDCLIQAAEDRIRAEHADCRAWESTAGRVFASAGLRAHSALDDALKHAIGLRCVDLLPLSDHDFVSASYDLLRDIADVKRKIVGGAVARRRRNGHSDGAALTAILHRGTPCS